MAAVSSAPATSAPGSWLTLSHRIQAPVLRHFTRLSPSPSPLRRLANVTGGSQMKKLWAQKPSAFGANTPDSNTSKNVASRSRSPRSDPPFLTILAGVMVFLLVLYVLGSLLMWLVGLIIYPPSR